MIWINAECINWMVGDEWGRKDSRLMVELEGNRRGDRVQVTRGRQNEIFGGSAALWQEQDGPEFQQQKGGWGEFGRPSEIHGLPWWLRQQRTHPQCGRSGLEDRRREWLSTPVFLPGEVHRQRSLAGYCPWGHKDSLCWNRRLHKVMLRKHRSERAGFQDTGFIFLSLSSSVRLTFLNFSSLFYSLISLFSCSSDIPTWSLFTLANPPSCS